MLEFQIGQSGWILRGNARQVVHNAVEEASRAVADQGVNEVRGQLRHYLQHSTGHYASLIQTDRRQADYAVTDGGAVYGPWLAGVPSAVRGTRFRGYPHWRRATERLNQQAAGIVGHILEQRLGGA